VLDSSRLMRCLVEYPVSGGKGGKGGKWW
jgi:hypothetical protein